MGVATHRHRREGVGNGVEFGPIENRPTGAEHHRLAGATPLHQACAGGADRGAEDIQGIGETRVLSTDEETGEFVEQRHPVRRLVFSPPSEVPDLGRVVVALDPPPAGIEGDGHPGVVRVDPNHIEHRRTETDPIPFIHRSLADLPPVDIGAVPALEIGHHERPVRDAEFGVLARHARHDNLDVGFVRRAGDVFAIHQVEGELDPVHFAGQPETVFLGCRGLFSHGISALPRITAARSRPIWR